MKEYMAQACLWLILNLADIATTIVGLVGGGMERNFLFADLSLYSFVVKKMVLALVVLCGLLWWRKDLLVVANYMLLIAIVIWNVV